MGSDEPKLFQGLVGQEHAVRFLTAAIAGGSCSHAYLFTGPAGVGKKAAAVELARALCCEGGGCGSCITCSKAAQGTHPDIEAISPPGAFITVDQVRAVNNSLNLHPNESRARVFIITDAGAFNSESANAFLKSLEEPPPFVYFLLLAERLDRVLPTIASRCQEVRFGPVPAGEIEGFLKQNCQVSEVMAQAYARVARGNLALARNLCDDSGLAARRQRYLAIGDNLSRGAWEGGPGQMAAEVLAAAEEAGHNAGGGDRALPEGFESGTKKQRQQELHRRASAAQKRELLMALDFLGSWFRDMLAAATGAGESVYNKDYELELEDHALPSRVDSYRGALEVIEATRSKLGYNIDQELALQAMFNELQEVL